MNQLKEGWILISTEDCDLKEEAELQKLMRKIIKEIYILNDDGTKYDKVIKFKKNRIPNIVWHNLERNKRLARSLRRSDEILYELRINVLAQLGDEFLEKTFQGGMNISRVGENNAIINFSFVKGIIY